MKFTVYYGRDFYEKGRETGRQMVERLLSKTAETENKEGSLNMSPSFSVDYMTDIRHPNVE